MRKLLKNYVEIRVVLLFYFIIIFSHYVFAADYNINISFYVQDEHGPKINSVVIQPNNISIGDLISLAVNATDTNQIKNITILIQNSSNNLSTIPLVNQSGNIWNSTWNSSNSSKGIYYITVLAYDNLSNKKSFDHSGIITIDMSESRTYSNNSFILVESNITVINASSKTNTEIGIISQSTINQVSVVIAYYSDDLFNKTLSGKFCLGKYIEILVSDAINNNLSQANIRFFYEESDYSSLGLDETSLRLYFWNITEWGICDSTGVDTVNNFVWANVTHLSTFTVFGVKPVITGPSSGGGSGGGFYGKVKDVIEETIKEDKKEKKKDIPEETDAQGKDDKELTSKNDSEQKSIIEKTEQVTPLQIGLINIVIYLLLLCGVSFYLYKNSEKKIFSKSYNQRIKSIQLRINHYASFFKNYFIGIIF